MGSVLDRPILTQTGHSLSLGSKEQQVLPLNDAIAALGQEAVPPDLRPGYKAEAA